MYKIANEPTPDIRSLRPEMPEELANVVLLAMEKRPEIRYADGQELAADLLKVAACLQPQSTVESTLETDPQGGGSSALGSNKARHNPPEPGPDAAGGPASDNNP